MKTSPLFRRPLLVALVAACLAWASAASAQSIETPARQAIVIDFDTGTVLLEKNADELMAPSSMSKLMTVFMVFEKLKSGAWKPTDMLPVSESAWKRHYKTEGSLMFLPVHSSVSVDDLLKGVVIQSGNDACSVLAEAYSGSEEAFAEAMTRRARQLGMTHSTFRNASGWPDPEHLMTARDLATLSRHLIGDFPDYYPLFSQMEFTFNGIKQGNRNPLLYTSAGGGGTPGADGLKTGHTQAGGFGLVASVKRGERRIVMVLNGMASMQQRADESRRLAEWAFREWDRYALFHAGETVVPDAPVWMGQSHTVPLVAQTDLGVTLPRRARSEMKVSVVFTGPIPAPIKAGTPVGKLVVTAPGLAAPIEAPLVAGADVARLGFGGRVIETIGNAFSSAPK